jgi:hypothetical protein
MASLHKNLGRVAMRILRSGPQWRQAGVLAGVTAGLVASATALIAHADVQSSSPSGFVVRIEQPIDSSPATAYTRLFEIGRWWSDAHTYSGKASSLTLKNEPGGCWCEALPGGGFVRHASLEYADPGKVARLSGGLGPLQALGVQGMLSFHFEPAGDRATRLVVSYVVSGYPTDAKGLAPLAESVNGVLKEQVERFRRYVETGKPTP